MQKITPQSKIIFFLVVFLTILTGCNIPQTPDAEPTTPPEEIAARETEAAAVILPTETPVPELRKAILIAAPDTNAYLLDRFRKGFENISEIPMTFVEAGTLSEGLLDDLTDYVFFTETPPDIADYAQKFPEIQFVVIGRDMQPFANVLNIRYDAGYEPFLAGYALSLSARDWRGAGLIPNDIAYREETFRNGFQYFCGRCQASIAPYVAFPVIVSIPSLAAPGDWSSGIDEILSNYIYSYYISPEVASDGIFQKFSGMDDVTLLGANDVPAGLESKWLATLRIDISGTIRKILRTEPFAPQTGEIIPDLEIIPGGVGNVFNQGRIIRIEEVYQNLLSGLVSAYAPIPPASFEK